MTFPQGACWLKGSLYVCSPPSLWKLTDTDGDGIADKREELVTGFEYTGNAADVHGPWLHPNGRLYWCHGRKGHKVVGKDGKVVHEGLACGIWSCKPDGTDVQWHSLGCGDNPVKVDFTPEGEVIGVQNLYYSQPRGDTIVHWLYGGVYERGDQMKAIEGLPRTLEHMPVMYNFGHVAVSGCTFYRSGALFPSPPLQFLVTHFNTQRVVRMELTPAGATYKATENEFLKLHDPDVHFTDVIEDRRDGSLLVINTGGWFRIGCPSSLMAKPDVMGAIYRVTKKDQPTLAKKEKSSGTQAKPSWKLKNEKEVLAQLKSRNVKEIVQACDWVTQHQPNNQEITKTVLQLLKTTSDPAFDHAAMRAALAVIDKSFINEPMDDDAFASRLLVIRAQSPGGAPHLTEELQHTAAGMNAESATRFPQLAHAIVRVASETASGCDALAGIFKQWLAAERISELQQNMMADIVAAHLASPSAQEIITGMLSHKSAQMRASALRILGNQTTNVTNEAWLPLLDKALAESKAGDLSLILDAVKKLRNSRFDAPLQTIANDTKRPLAIRLKALDAMKGLKLTAETFAMLQAVLTKADSSAAARIQAAGMLAHASLQKDQISSLSPVLASVGPLELKSLLSLVSKCKDVQLARTVSLDLAKNPVIGSQQESVYRTAFSSQPPELFETIVLPALHKANEVAETKMRQLGPLADKVIAQGDPKAGKLIYESGKSVCIACHQVGDKGRAIGPNLSHIGAIRTERDLLESIIFPSNTLARDYEAHVIETSDGQNMMGVIKSHTADGLVLVDATGLEKSIPDSQIVANTTLTTSLMPLGLDQTLNEKELCDLVAWLRSLK
jgi:putative heme-binding domain-containing protein